MACAFEYAWYHAAEQSEWDVPRAYEGAYTLGSSTSSAGANDGGLASLEQQPIQVTGFVV